MEVLPQHMEALPSLPNIQGRPTSRLSVGMEKYPSASNFALPSSAKLRRQLSRTSASSPQKWSRSESPKSVSSESTEIQKLNWQTTNILDEDVYEEKKERLLRTSKLRKELEVYFNVETPSRLAERNPEPTKDEDYDTDLDTDLVSCSLIVDEKTKQIKDDGEFPEYKNLCRKYKTVPNSFFIRHSLDDELSMKHRYLSPSDCKAIGWEVENHLTFKKLDLEDNGIGPKQLISLAEMLLKNKYLQEVNLSNNPMGQFGAEIMKIILLNNSHIVKVDLTGNNFNEKAGFNMSEVLESNCFLKELYIGKNQIADEGATYIGRALEMNMTLEVLDLSWNRISRIGAAKIASGLKLNHSLTTLNMSMNGLGADGCRVMFEGLKGNESLTSLDLSANRIPDSAADYISKVIPQDRALTILKLSFNNFTADGCLTILKPLGSKMKKKLSLIEMDGMDVNEELCDMIQRLTDKRGFTVTLNQPPSRRAHSLDNLTKALVSISKFLLKNEMDLLDLFPDLEKKKEELCNTYQIIELIKTCGKELNRAQIAELRRICKGIRKRQFLLKEFATVYSLQQEGRNPLQEDPLRTPFGGKRRGGSIERNKPKSAEVTGVRFS